MDILQMSWLGEPNEPATEDLEAVFELQVALNDNTVQIGGWRVAGALGNVVCVRGRSPLHSAHDVTWSIFCPWITDDAAPRAKLNGIVA